MTAQLTAGPRVAGCAPRGPRRLPTQGRPPDSPVLPPGAPVGDRPPAVVPADRTPAATAGPTAVERPSDLSPAAVVVVRGRPDEVELAAVVVALALVARRSALAERQAGTPRRGAASQSTGGYASPRSWRSDERHLGWRR